MFLSIGFIQPHKGFDRAIRAFRGLGERGARLYVVGSLRLDEGEYATHLDELRELAAQTPGVDLVVGYVSDELFDRWIVAADYVVLPYRHIWSSGVAERAAIYHRPVIVTRVGGLAEQVADRDDVTLVSSDGELQRAMARALGGAEMAQEQADWPTGGDDLRALVQAEVRARAARRRGVPLSATTLNGHAAGGRHRSLSTSVRSLPPLAPPAPVSGRPGATLVKRMVQRGVGWLVDPVYWQVNALRDATVRALDQTDTQFEDVPRGDPPPVVASETVRRPDDSVGCRLERGRLDRGHRAVEAPHRGCRAVPVELSRPLSTTGHDTVTLRTVGRRGRESRRQRLGLTDRYHDRRVARDLHQRRVVGDDHGHAVGHRLDHGEAETLGPARHGDHAGTRVQSGEVAVPDPPRDPDPPADASATGQRSDVDVAPPWRPDDDKVEPGERRPGPGRRRGRRDPCAAPRCRRTGHRDGRAHASRDVRARPPAPARPTHRG